MFFSKTNYLSPFIKYFLQPPFSKITALIIPDEFGESDEIRDHSSI